MIESRQDRPALDFMFLPPIFLPFVFFGEAHGRLTRDHDRPEYVSHRTPRFSVSISLDRVRNLPDQRNKTDPICHPKFARQGPVWRTLVWPPKNTRSFPGSY